MRRENVQHVLVPYGIKLPEVVNCEIIEKVSSLIRKEHIDAAEILTLVLCMLYMSMENSYVRIKHLYCRRIILYLLKILRESNWDCLFC